MVLGFEIAANLVTVPSFSLFPGRLTRQQRLAPFHSMPKPQKSKWGNDIRNMHRNCVMQLPLLLLCSSPLPRLSLPPLSTAWCSFLSSHLQLSSSSISPPHDADSSPPQLSSPPSISSAALLHMMQLPLLSHLQLSSPPLLSAAWCSILSSSALPHLSPLPHLSSAALHCVMQLPLFPHLQLSSAWCSFLSSLICSSPLLHLTAALLRVMQHPLHLSPLLLSTAWCIFLSSLICSSPPSHLQLSSISLLCCSPLRDAASSPLSYAALLHLSSVWCSSPLLSHLQLSSPPSHRCSSPPLFTAWCSILSSALPHLSPQLLFTALCSFLSSLNCSSPPSLIWSSPPSLLYLSPLLLYTAWCSFLSHLQLYSPPSLRCSPLRDAASSQLTPQLRDAASSPPSSAALLHLSFAALLSYLSPLLLYTAWCNFLSSSAALLSSISPLRDAASSQLSPHPSAAWCSFLSSVICSSPPLHLSSLLLSTAWCSFLSSSAALLSSISPLRDAASSPPLRDAASSPPSSAALLHLSPLRDAASSPLSYAALPLQLSSSIPPLLLSSPPPLSIPLLSSVFPPPGTGIGYPVPICHQNFIKDWLDIWLLSVGLASDQHWSEFGDHCSCIWFGEETSYNMS